MYVGRTQSGFRGHMKAKEKIEADIATIQGQIRRIRFVGPVGSFDDSEAVGLLDVIRRLRACQRRQELWDKERERVAALKAAVKGTFFEEEVESEIQAEPNDGDAAS